MTTADEEEGMDSTRHAVPQAFRRGCACGSVGRAGCFFSSGRDSRLPSTEPADNRQQYHACPRHRQASGLFSCESAANRRTGTEPAVGPFGSPQGHQETDRIPA